PVEEETTVEEETQTEQELKGEEKSSGGSVFWFCWLTFMASCTRVLTLVKETKYMNRNIKK
ncbi:hypothetical protein, partial [Thalassotalea crassostreae]